MPKHEVHFQLPERQIMNSDAKFHIYSDDKLLGELKISKGSLGWRPNGHSREIHLSWECFDAMLRDKMKK